MSDERTESTTTETAHEHAHDHHGPHGNPDVHAHPHAEHTHSHDEEEVQAEPLTIDIAELTEEGRQRAEKQLKRKIEDVPFKIAGDERRPGSLRVIRFEVAADAFEASQERLLQDWSKDVALPGFRKGKAPLRLLKIRLGEDARRNAVREVATNVLRQENIKQDLKLVAKPVISDYTEPKDGAPLTIEVETEIEPAVELKEHKGFSVEVEEQPFDEARVNEKLEGLRKENAVMETAPEGTALEATDGAVLDIEVVNARGEKLAHLSAENKLVGDLSRALPGDVLDAVLGKKTGETAEADVEIKSTNRRGEEVSFTDHYKVTVKEIRRSRLPALDDEFAKDLGEHDSLDALKASLRKEIESGEAARQRQEALGKIFEQLITKNPVDVPRSMMAMQQYQMIERDRRELARVGLRLEQVVQDAEKYMNDQRSGAETQVKLQLLLRELSKSQNLEVTDADVDAEIEAMAGRSGRKPLAIRARLEAERGLDRLREQLRVRKLEDTLLAGSTVTKVAPKPVEENSAASEAEGNDEGVSEAEEVKPSKAARKKSTK